MIMKWTVVYLVTVAILGQLCSAVYNPKYNQQERSKYNPPAQQESKYQEPIVQTKDSVDPPIQWRFPTDPQPEPKVEVPFSQRSPVPAVTVAVECRERNARIEVKRDMFGTGQLVNPADLTLGNCAAVGEDSGARVLIFETDLHLCDSRLMMTSDSLIYSFILNYNPRPLGATPAVRTSSAAIAVECHYPRNHNVSSQPLVPQWIPFSATKISSELLYFDLVLKTEDWLYERPVFQYYLGDIINIEATVKQYLHTPLRVFVDSCAATAEPDLNSNPRYNFIENYGCLVDAKLTGSASKFMPRTYEHTLQFQLEAFRFQGSSSGLVYITCNLRATSAARPIDEMHRACSYTNGWLEASGVNGVCGSCDTITSSGGSGGGGGSDHYNPNRKSRDVSSNEVVEWETTVTLPVLNIGQC